MDARALGRGRWTASVVADETDPPMEQAHGGLSMGMVAVVADETDPPMEQAHGGLLCVVGIVHDVAISSGRKGRKRRKG